MQHNSTSINARSQSAALNSSELLIIISEGVFATLKKLSFYCGLLALVILLTSASISSAPFLSANSVYVASPGELPFKVQSREGRVLDAIAPGSTVYFPIVNAVRAQDVDGWRVVIADWISGQEYIQDTRIEYLEVFDNDKTTSHGFMYAAALSIVDTLDKYDGLVNARIAVTQKRPDAKWKDFSFMVRPKHITSPTDSITCSKKNMPMTFSNYTKSISITFGSCARFDVNVQSQSDVNIGFSSEPLTDIVISYPNAELQFFTWTKRPVFNRVGQLYLYAQPNSYLYSLENGNLRLVKTSYSNDENAFVLSTRRLGNLILSNQILADPLPLSSRPNPPTGFLIF
jgi:hypothetical protein